ncbi:MAG: serine/threonine-protein kinase [Bryobacteraceae bacterium]|nr:serine/threonine-protein kinase [Bryobacteraceae bacterium]
MPLSAGEKLGPYEILSAIGAGGMGEVYKARDTRLDRTVAVKVLPEHIALRDDVRARFEREARAVASLNHPNICSLFDIGPGYMVMELIEGETLASRIEKGPLPLDQALKFAAQIADALDRAHRAGVTHRDVKPQNIMLTRDGVKVLDFGLAKSVTSKPGPTDETLTKALTAEGTIMGTPQYMAPEQFAGKEADARSDIWAFGAVLYEMVTGRNAFQGANYQSLVGAILAMDPPPMAVKPFTPSWLERLVRRCLAKDPEERWQSMRDIVLELRSPPEEKVATAKASRWPWAIATTTAVLSLLIVAWALSRSARDTASDQAYRFQLTPPEGGQFDHSTGFALSPDGRTLALVATATGKSGLWVRPLDGTAARLLPGTELAQFPLWSPDGRSLAYGASGRLWRVDVAGGSPITICDVPTFAGGDWSPEGFIVFSVSTRGLLRVAASGGTPKLLAAPDTRRGETSYYRPQMLTGGRILFRIAGTPEVAGIYVMSLANPKERIRMKSSFSNGLYAAGYLLSLSGSTLIAERFDPERLKLSGEPRPVASPVGSGTLRGMAVAASTSGLLVYGQVTGEQLTWLDHAGHVSPLATHPERGTLGEPGDYLSFRVSPDGRRATVGRTSGTGRDLWMVETERDTWSRFTFLPGSALNPVWSPDGRQVMFRGGAPLLLHRKETSGAGTEQRVTESANVQYPTDWSRNGRLVLYYELAPDTQRDLWVLPVTSEGKPAASPRPYLRTRSNEYHGRFSPEPNPRWVAYTSDESGRDEVYLQSFPEPRTKFQISTGGGTYPEWSPDGRELYYLSADGKLMAVDVKLGADSMASSTPRGLFALRTGTTINTYPYSVAPDGKRFLVLTPAGGSQPLEVIVNWPALLKAGATQP